ncbi:myeloid cell surface antigen CD33 [Aulostomus maculatus]
MEGKGKLMIVGLLLAALNMTVFTEEWKASTVPTLNALVTSCVVLPCSFTHPKDGLPTSRLRGTWHLLEDKNSKIYHADSAKVLDNYKGRTSLSGNLSQGNCTLQIVNVKDHDNGPFCFRIELIDHMGVENSLDKFSFVKDCVSINMLNEPPKPTLTHAKAAIEGHPFTVTCSVTHSCPFRPPTLQWSRGEPEHITERETQRGTWEVQSILVIIPEENDNFQEVTCTATFDGGATSSSQLTLYVKRIENYNHIIIPAVVGVATIAIIGGVCLFILKKYKDQITALQSQDGSMWNRLSRMSRR